MPPAICRRRTSKGSNRFPHDCLGVNTVVSIVMWWKSQKSRLGNSDPTDDDVSRARDLHASAAVAAATSAGTSERTVRRKLARINDAISRVIGVGDMPSMYTVRDGKLYISSSYDPYHMRVA